MDIDLHHQEDNDIEESSDPVIWSRYQQAQHAMAIKANESFVAAMNKAITRGREKVKPGTTIDLSPPIGAKRLYGILPMSACGSPAAMCMEAGGAQAGAEVMK